MFVFELTTMTSFFSSIKGSLPPTLSSHMDNICIKYFDLLLPEMNYIEVMKMLKYTIYDEKNELKQSKLSQ